MGGKGKRERDMRERGKRMHRHRKGGREGEKSAVLS
jgi:hypothetical protein